jgi:peptidoglycan/xylan/chitin deacetylase (PgdA/CDA1 family)
MIVIAFCFIITISFIFGLKSIYYIFGKGLGNDNVAFNFNTTPSSDSSSNNKNKDTNLINNLTNVNRNYLNSILGNNDNDIKKWVMLSFDDSKKGQITYAKPILDKYGFKATFFVLCNITTEQDFMNWQDISKMKADGMDIESHTMTHPHLNNVSQDRLEYEIGGSKQCLDNHGYNATIFAYPYNDGSNNATVVNTVAKYYNIARSGSEPLMFLNCIGFSNHHQPDCRTYAKNGHLNFANRYDARSFTVDTLEMKDKYESSEVFSDFVKVVNSQNKYNNKNGENNAIPLITFHDVGLTNNTRYVTNVNLFDELMKYLYNNGFKVLNFQQLGFDTGTNTFYLKDLS